MPDPERHARLSSVIEFLQCPHCRSPLTIMDATVCCPRGHSFDIARQGYLNLLKGTAGRNADTSAMVEARVRFLQGGHYDLITDAIDRLLGPTPMVLDAGAGPAYHLARLLTARPDSRGLALDVSAAACRRAARAHPRAAAVVTDLWQPMPLGSGIFDLVLCVFAPRQPVEFARVLRPDGALVVVTPHHDHLIELRRRLDLIEVDPGKSARLATSLKAHFEAQHLASLRGTIRLCTQEIIDVVMMGPNAFHTDPAALAGLLPAHESGTEVTVALELGIYRPRR